jgi:hypothetical protein
MLLTNVKSVIHSNQVEPPLVLGASSVTRKTLAIQPALSNRCSRNSCRHDEPNVAPVYDCVLTMGRGCNVLSGPAVPETTTIEESER